MRLNPPKLNATGKRGIGRDYTLFVLGSLFLFGSAGTFSWMRGWIYIGLTLSYQILYTLLLLHINPQLLNERGKFNWKDTKRYDRYFGILYALAGFSLLIIAGLDAVRFKWSTIPEITIYPSILVFILCSLLAYWAYHSNSHFILTSRDDKLNKQQICTTGPYRYLRHPGYSAAILSSLCYPLILGSWYSFIPVFIIILLLVIRTSYEDKTLKKELHGYDDYSKKTKYRLFPYLW